jgi:hypothetical protein
MRMFDGKRSWEEEDNISIITKKVCSKCGEFKYEFLESGECLDCAMGVENGNSS